MDLTFNSLKVPVFQCFIQERAWFMKLLNFGPETLMCKQEGLWWVSYSLAYQSVHL